MISRRENCVILFSDLIFALENSNDHISATDRPIHFMFGFRVGFSGSVNRTALFPTR